MDSPLCTFYHPVWSAPPVKFSHISVFIYRVAYIQQFLSIFSIKMEKKNFTANKELFLHWQFLEKVALVDCSSFFGCQSSSIPTYLTDWFIIHHSERRGNARESGQITSNFLVNISKLEVIWVIRDGTQFLRCFILVRKIGRNSYQTTPSGSWPYVKWG